MTTERFQASRLLRLATGVFCVLALALPASAADQTRIKTLFLGDDGHHKPAQRATELMGPLAKAGIDMAYTEDLADLNAANLDRYDALIIYANHTRISPQQEQALLDFVEGGHGLVVLHCGSYCFLNSPKYIALVGGQFKRHDTGTFTAKIDKPDHPAMKGVEPFEAFDETYEHTKLSDDRTVLMHRDADNGRQEPWTWVRTQGKGRVYYTASGHDERVFTNPGYHKLVIQGITWAVGRPDFDYQTAPFTRSPGELPDYLGSTREKAARLHDMQDPLSVAESMKHISVPGGFRTELVASDPDIFKPICLSWDDQGRLWIAETKDYPNEKETDDSGHDRIVICEDTDGDHQADTFKVFADHLSIPTSMVHVPGGLIVTSAPNVLFFADTDGDDKADVKKVLFSGFHTNDTHAGPSNLRLGFDGWIYATVGYAGFNGEVGGKRLSFRQSLFRFKPDGSELEVLTSTSNNTWGLGLTETGEVVYSTANGEHSSYLGLPNREFESVRGWLGKGNDRMADHDRMHPLTAIRQVDWFGGYTAAAGHSVYTARQFPRDFWDRIAFVCEPTGHLVHMGLLERQGSHLVSHDRFNLFASTDEWTSPIVAEVGPDGAVWVIDWYNYVVQHNPTPLGFETGKGNAYVTPLRDKTHGRIYRVINTTSPLGKSYDLSKASPDELVQALNSDNLLWRLKAQWRLVDRGKQDVVPALLKMAADRQVDDLGQNPSALHALCTLRGLGVLDRDHPDAHATLETALRHPASGVRLAALDALPRSTHGAVSILQAGLLSDPSPVVRRQALVALSECPSSEVAGLAILTMLRAPENAQDRWIPLAATSAAARFDLSFLSEALAAEQNPEAVRKVVRIVAEHYARGDHASKSVHVLLDRLPDTEPGDTEALLAGLAAGWPANQPPSLDDATQTRLITLMSNLDTATQLSLATLANRWNLEGKFGQAMKSLRERLASEAADEGRPEAERIASADRLAHLNPDAEEIEALLELITPRASPSLASGLLNALGSASSPAVAEALLAHWNRFTPALRKQALDLLLQRGEWTESLLTGLENGPLSVTDLSIDQSRKLTEHPNRAYARKARKLMEQGGRLPSPDRQKVLSALLPLTERTGDVNTGLEVFKKNCAKCHKHGDLGETIGPNLTGFNVHPKEKILTEIIDPNRSVEGNYRQYTVATAEGQVLTGLLASETRTAIELVDSEAKRHVVLRDDIDEMIASPQSLMPEGFEKQISEAEFTDLLEFLTAKGKYVPLPLDKAATIVSTRGMFISKDGDPERLIFPDWTPKMVDGIPFILVDPQGDRVPNVILLHSNSGPIPREMPRAVSLPCNSQAKAIHLLSGVSGWGFPYGQEKTVSMIVRLHYADGSTEDHPLRNGVEFADYIRRVDVPGSRFAFNLRGQQIRYLSIQPKRSGPIETIEFVKGPDSSAPVVMAVTVERP